MFGKVRKRGLKLGCLTAGIIAAQMMNVGPARALSINLIDTGGVAGSAAEQGFLDAASVWETLLADDVTVNLNVGFQSLGASVLGQTGSSLFMVGYQATRNALVADATSVADSISTSSLPTGQFFDTFMNRTLDNPNGSLSATPYLDDDDGRNNENVFMTSANFRALGGVIAGNEDRVDAAITFSSDFAFDFDDSDGIDSGSFDFVGVAIHEIGHALGFVSGVDALDTGNPLIGGTLNDVNILSSTLDLFRYSDLSAASGVIDMSADDRDKFFSIDGGTTNLGLFSEGVNLGDGRQASHWKDGLGLGLLDPTLSAGEFGIVTGLDLAAFDVIGWDITPALVAVPLPGALPMFLAGLVGIGILRRRKLS